MNCAGVGVPVWRCRDIGCDFYVDCVEGRAVFQRVNSPGCAGPCHNQTFNSVERSGIDFPNVISPNADAIGHKQ